MLHTLLDVVSTGGSEILSVESTYAQIMRAIQAGVFAGIIYLIKLLKETKGNTGVTQDILQKQNERVEEVKQIAQTNFETNHVAIETLRTELKEAGVIQNGVHKP